MRRQVAGVALLSLLAAGCGSTVDQRTTGYGDRLGAMPQSSEPGTSGGQFGGPATGGTTGAVTGAGGNAATPGALVGGSTGTTTGRTGSTGGTTGAPAPGAKLPGRHKGVSDSTIKLGFLYLASAGTTVGAFGVKGYSQGDELGEFRALVADQNARGGVAGRKLVVVPRDLGGIDESSYQAACTFLTQDSPVFMVMTALGHVESLNTCLAKGDVGYTSNYVAPPDRMMRAIGPVYAPDDIGAERYAALIGRSLVDAGYFGSAAKVGIIRLDTPDYARITRDILRPILARAGVEVVAEETVSSTDASAALGDTGPMVFRLRGKGVTHVVNYDSPLFYMTAAESQGWRPWWTVTSRSGPGSFLEGSAPAEQLRKTMGPGWQPVSDLATARIKGTINSEEARCLATLAKAGYSYTGTPRYVGQMLCGELFHFVRVLATAAEVSTSGFRSAAEALGPYPSPMTFSMSFAGGRHDGAAGYRLVAWRDDCNCYQYTTPIRPMPAS